MTTHCQVQTDESVEGAAPIRRHHIIQIHPTLACNLTCLHCYSHSAPGRNDELNFDDLTLFLADARTEYYDVISISGGEPFLYKRLEELLLFSRSAGYTNALVTNAMLLGSAYNRRLLSLTDLVAISVDGPPELHNYVRNSPKAFEKMSEGVHIVRQEVAKMGIIHSVSRRSWDSLLWLGDWANERHADLLQLHLLEETGRAETDMAGESIDDLMRHKVFILATYLKQKYEPSMQLQLDMITRQSLLQAAGERGEGLLNSFLSEIVIDECGNIVPFSYGFPNEFIIGNISERLPLRTMLERFTEQQGDALLALVQRVQKQLHANEVDDFINWGEYFIKAAQEPTSLAVA
jgi:MoaA/NifB/PqqE/SkfB family radical SAM enzyme